MAVLRGTVTIALLTLLGGTVVFYSPSLISCHEMYLILYFVRHSYFLDRYDQISNANLAIFSNVEGLDAMKVDMSQILYSS